MPSSRRPGRRLLGALAALSLVAALLPASTAAVSVSPNATQRSFSCSLNWTWKGSVYNLLGTQNRGTFDHCYYLYQLGVPDSSGKIQDGDASYDTYVMIQEVDWEVTDVNGGTDNPMQATTTSSIAAVGNSFAAAPKTISSSACSPVSFSAGWAGFGVGVSEILCDGVVLTRDTLNATKAGWSAKDVMKTKSLELAYMIKVNQGAKPTFTIRVYYPFFGSARNGPPYCGGGYCYPTWTYDHQMYASGWNVKAP